MSEVPSDALRHLAVPPGACSFHSGFSGGGTPAEGEGFAQSDNEFALDVLSPRDRRSLLAALAEVDLCGIELETAVFLRGYLLGEVRGFGGVVP